MSGAIPEQELQGGLREFSFLIQQPFVNGLAPDARVPRNSVYASVMKNLRPTPYGAITPEVISNPVTSGPTPNWATAGTVQMFRGERNRWVMGQTQGYSATSAWVASAVGASFAAGGPWHGVFFQELPFFTNGTVFLWGTTLARVTTPTVNAVGKHDNRLLLGGLAGPVFSAALFQRVLAQWKNTHTGDRLSYTAQAWDTGWLIYGERGGGSSDRPFDALLALLLMYTSDQQTDLEGHVLSALERYEWGMCPLRYPGAVMAFHELASGSVVFGENGVAGLTQDGDIYRDERLHPIGIAGRGAVGGDLRECVFVDTNKEVWRIRSGGSLERLGFDMEMTTLTAADITISFDPLERTFWIADKAKAYVINSDGKMGGYMEVVPTSLVREAGSLYGVVRDRRTDPAVTPIEFRTMPLDIMERGHKMVDCLQVGMENVTRLAGGVDYRYTGSTYAEGPRTQATPGAAIFPYPRVSFVDCKAVLTGNVAATDVGRLERIEFRYNAEDLTYRRGTKGIPEQG